MKKNSLIIFAGVVLIVAGGWFGVNFLLKREGTPTSTIELVKAPTVVEKTAETSKVVVDEEETAQGETTKGLSGTIASVSGQVVVLESEGDRLQVALGPETEITRRTWPKGAKEPEIINITLEQLQIGDKVDAFVTIVGGKATASSIIVIVEP